MDRSDRTTNPIFLCLLAALVMAYGWGYRGVTGHEGGAMVPGAMLGMAVCLGSGRLDWRRRAAVAGLFGAVGWAWGGSLSYMEQTFYTVSDSLPDVLYGYAMLFFLGGLWAGIGGAVLGMAFTMPRSRLARFAGPFTAICAVFLLTYLYFLFNDSHRDAFERFTAEHFHDGDWFAALTVIIVSGIYMPLRPKERAEAGLFLACGLAWWTGYLALTYLGGLRLGPPYRSESWGGVLGILLALLAYLARERNRAALMVSFYGILGGGIAFALAVFVRHPIRVEWGPFASWGQMMQWKIAEESFGFFMGLAIAFSVLRLIRGGLAPAEEDVPPRPLDVYAVFVILVAIMWVNLRRAPMAWINRYHAVHDQPVAGLMAWEWYTLGGTLLTLLAVYALWLYWRGNLVIAPPTAYGKGALVLIFLLWLPAIGSFVQQLPAAREKDHPLVDATFITLASAATAMLLSQHRAARVTQTPVALTTPTDPKWALGPSYFLICACVPFMLLGLSALSMAMQDGPAANARKRFGPEAYWRQATRIVGEWNALGLVKNTGDIPPTENKSGVRSIEFLENRAVSVTFENGARQENGHRWLHADSVIWLEWYARTPGHPDQKRIPMTLQDQRLYIPWPPDGDWQGFAVFERSNAG